MLGPANGDDGYSEASMHSACDLDNHLSVELKLPFLFLFFVNNRQGNGLSLLKSLSKPFNIFHSSDAAAFELRTAFISF